MSEEGPAPSAGSDGFGHEGAGLQGRLAPNAIFEDGDGAKGGLSDRLRKITGRRMIAVRFGGRGHGDSVHAFAPAE